jgi:uncharacterized membrane-anchored protein
MAEQEQQQDHRPGVQHLAFLQQTQRQSQTAGGHNPWAAEAGLEAHLQQQRYQEALAVVQGLERERLQKCLPVLVVSQPR